MQLPDFLEKYRARGEQTFLHGRVQEIHFSGSTYVVTVSDESLEEPVFVFLQLEWNRVKDIFCNCERSEASGGCEHMAAACHAVFLKRAEPLGIQFDHSLFKALFFQLFKKSGIHPLKRSKEGKTTTITTFENEPLFS
ncbi:MAG TPA: SWIM zinc finger family protein, partial [Chlamydiales bacterium]|nr:SWIM zinc finger family protein [Chlamydiales bacterium]